jgi:5-methyltetrahydropteroyltriglutamate--homocysteine methyltransferase
MKRSIKKILTTHTGSLPRPEDLLALLRAKEDGTLSDRAEFDSAVRDAVAETVRKQVEAGVDVINDGEMSKPGYSTYVKDRLSGFEGQSSPLTGMLADIRDFPEYGERLYSQRSTAALKRPACSGPIQYRDTHDLELDIANLKAATAGIKVEEIFMSAASPGVISVFLANNHYPTREAYLGALADAMRTEYEAVYRAGFLLQVDCPDLAMNRHMQFADLKISEFRKQAAMQVEALNHALANIPAEAARLHLCWGNYEGPHHRDVPMKDIIDVVLKAKPAGISFEASNPRHEHEWKIWKDIKLPTGKVLIPGVLDSSTNFIEHPELVAERIVRFANVVGRENVIAGSDCGFSTFAGMTVVDPKITWAKLKAMAEGARIASRELWKKVGRPAPVRGTAVRRTSSRQSPQHIEHDNKSDAIVTAGRKLSDHLRKNAPIPARARRE